MATGHALNIGDLDYAGTLPLMVASFPMSSNLKGLFLFGQGEDYLTANYAVGGVDGAIVGGVSAEDGYAVFGSEGYIQTNIDETAEMSVLIICKRPDPDQNCGFFGAFSGSGGVSIHDAAGGGVNLNASVFRGGSAAQTTVTSVLDEWGMYEVDIPNSAGTVVRNLTDTASTTGGNTNSRSGIGVSGKLKIGASSATYAGEVHICAIAIWTGAVISNDVRVAAAEKFKSEYANYFGIDV